MHGAMRLQWVIDASVYDNYIASYIAMHACVILVWQIHYYYYYYYYFDYTGRHSLINTLREITQQKCHTNYKCF